MSRTRHLVAALCLALLAAACGDDGDEGTTGTTAAPTTTVVATTTERQSFERLAEAFPALEGYELVELPPAVIEQTEAEFLSDPDTELIRDSVVAVDGRSVLQDGESVAIVIAVGFERRAGALPGVAESFMRGATEESASTEDLELAGEPAVLASDADGTTYVAWANSELGLVVVGGPNVGRDALIAAAEALIGANA